jgi:hypothetical protein
LIIRSKDFDRKKVTDNKPRRKSGERKARKQCR